MKIDKNRFGFLNAKGGIVDGLLHRVNTILMGILDAKPYELDWDHVMAEYDKLGIGDVAEFANNYAFGWHAKEMKLDDVASKQAMYVEIIDGIVARRKDVR